VRAYEVRHTTLTLQCNRCRALLPSDNRAQRTARVVGYHTQPLASYSRYTRIPCPRKKVSQNVVVIGYLDLLQNLDDSDKIRYVAL